MAGKSKETASVSTEAQPGQEPVPTQSQPAGETVAGHGKTGEGAGSALAQLLSLEQARAVPAMPEDRSNDSG